MNNKTFIFISTLEHLPWGGCEDLWYKTALLALEKGSDVLALVFRHDEEPAHIKELRNAGAKVFFLKRPGRPASLIKKIQQKIFSAKIHQTTLQELSKNAAQKNCTLIISQAGGFDFAYSYLDELKGWITEQGIPYHVIVQNVPDLGFTLQPANAEKQRNIFLNAQGVYFVSKRNIISTERILACHLTNAKAVNNPLNLAPLDSFIAFPKEKSKVSFAVVAALRCFHKGQDILLQVLACDAWKGREWELNLFGKGPDEVYLKNLASYYKIADRIHFHGHVKDITEVWSKNHIHILPSLGEGTPLALIESMYCGRPAITSDVGGNTEYCEDGVSGFVCDYPTPAALNRVMERAWAERERWEQMGRNAFEKIRSSYNLNAAAEMYQLISR